jgi:CHAT domain-containing protein
MLRYMIICFLLVVPRVSWADDRLMDEAFRAAQEGMQSQAGAALRQIGLRTAAGSSALAEAVRARQDIEERLRAAEVEIARPGADRIGLAGRIAEMQAELAAADARLERDFPRYAGLTRPRPLSVAEVQGLLAPGEALVLTFIGETYAFVWAITPDRVAWHRVNAGRATTAEGVTRLRAALDPSVIGRGAEALDEGSNEGLRVAPFPRKVARLIYDVFLEPLSPVLEGAAHVYVVPDGPLTALPFAVMITADAAGEDDDPAALRATPWLIRRHALTTLPSVESLAVVKRFPPSAPDRPVLAGYGDPVFDGGGSLASLARGAPLVAGGVADIDRLRSLPPLPGTRRELLSIARILGADPATLRLGAEATEAAVKQGIGPAKVVAFATHGLLSGEIAGLAEPALVLTPPDRPGKLDDGLLMASEIVDLTLDADWVLLSACNTAGGAEPGAEGLSGLARAFLFAGARSIVVSHWPVRDDAAARLTTQALAEAQDGVGRAEALRRSMLDLMEDSKDPTLAHPSAWAPFVMVGQGG